MDVGAIGVGHRASLGSAPAASCSTTNAIDTRALDIRKSDAPPQRPRSLTVADNRAADRRPEAQLGAAKARILIRRVTNSDRCRRNIRNTATAAAAAEYRKQSRSNVAVVSAFH